MNKIEKIGFLGGGRIAQAMAKGFISAGLKKAESILASVHPSDSVSLKSFKNLGVDTLTKNAPVIENSDIIFISVKPQVVPQVLNEIKSKSDEKLFISVAMGITIKTLEQKLGIEGLTKNFPVIENSNTVFISVKPQIVTQVLNEIKSKSDEKLFISLAMGITLKTLEQNLLPSARVIRAMPNTPALVQSGCSVFVRGSRATDEDAQKTQTLLQAIGTCEEVDEYLLDPITALSGSGPAYVFVMIEALADGAVRMGIPRDMAYRLASQTVMGSGHLVRDSKEHPGVLKDNVTSPAGSTAAALKYLEEAGFRAAVAGAVEAATLRCREMSEDQ